MNPMVNFRSCSPIQWPRVRAKMSRYQVNLPDCLCTNSQFTDVLLENRDFVTVRVVAVGRA